MLPVTNDLYQIIRATFKTEENAFEVRNHSAEFRTWRTMLALIAVNDCLANRKV